MLTFPPFSSLLNLQVLMEERSLWCWSEYWSYHWSDCALLHRSCLTVCYLGKGAKSHSGLETTQKNLCLQQPCPTDLRGRCGIPSSGSPGVPQSNPRTLLIFTPPHLPPQLQGIRGQHHIPAVCQQWMISFTDWPTDLHHRYTQILHYKTKPEDKK